MEKSQERGRLQDSAEANQESDKAANRSMQGVRNGSQGELVLATEGDQYLDEDKLELESEDSQPPATTQQAK